MHLTDMTVRALQPPLKGQKIYHDDMKGFAVRVSQGGAKTFLVIQGKARTKTTIGRYPDLTLAKAREKAKTILAERTLKRTEGEPSKLFDNALDLFINSYLKQNNRPSSAKETERLLRRHFEPKFKAKRLAAIRKQDILAIVDDLSETPSEANHAFTAAKTLWKWLASRDYASDALGGLRRPFQARSRERVLDDTELALVLKYAAQAGTFGKLVELLIRTGQRVGQYAPEFTGTVLDDTIVWSSETMKGDKEHVIPLTSATRALLADLPRFNNFSNAKAEFDTHVAIPHWTLHDLRRTFSTGLAKLGVPPHVTERLLAHQVGSMSSVALIYNRFTYFPEMKAALRTWEAHLESLLKS